MEEMEGNTKVRVVEDGIVCLREDVNDTRFECVAHKSDAIGIDPDRIDDIVGEIVLGECDRERPCSCDQHAQGEDIKNICVVDLFLRGALCAKTRQGSNYFNYDSVGREIPGNEVFEAADSIQLKSIARSLIWPASGSLIRYLRLKRKWIFVVWGYISLSTSL